MYLFIYVRCILIQSLQQLLFASSTTAQPILTPRVQPPPLVYVFQLLWLLDFLAKSNSYLAGKLVCFLHILTYPLSNQNNVPLLSLGFSVSSFFLFSVWSRDMMSFPVIDERA